MSNNIYILINCFYIKFVANLCNVWYNLITNIFVLKLFIDDTY